MWITVPPTAAFTTSAAPPVNVRVALPDGRDDQQPSLAVDPRNTKVLALAYQSLSQGGSERSCGFAASTDGGTHWSSSILYGPGGRSAVPNGSAACWNPSAVYGADGTLYYCFQTSVLPGNPYSRVLVTSSRDGGASFGVPADVDAGAPLFPGQRAGGDWWPSLALDEHRGTVYITWSQFTAGLDSSRILLAASTDAGHTFLAPAVVSPPEQLDVTGSVVAVSGDGDVYVTWTDYTQWERGDLLRCGGAGCSPYGFTDAQMRQALRDFYADEGARLDFTQGLGCEAFRTPVMSEDGLDGRGLNRGGSCALPAAVQTAHSSDDGTTWQQGSPPASSTYLGCYVEYPDEPPPWPSGHVCDATHFSNYNHNLVRSATSITGIALAVAWWDTGGYSLGGTARVSVATSDDSTSTWRTTMAACLPPGLSADQQHRPMLSVAPDGRLDLACYDLNSGGHQSVYCASASRIGATFATPVRIDSDVSSASVGPASDDGRASFGDHLAVASTNDRVDVAWTDTRSGLTHQAIFFAALPVHSGASGSPRGLSPLVAVFFAGIGGLVLIGVTAAFFLVRRRRVTARARA